VEGWSFLVPAARRRRSLLSFSFWVRAGRGRRQPPTAFRPSFPSLPRRPTLPLSHACSRLLSINQAADINALFGFRLECIERLGDPHGIWAWTRLNALFNYLPLAALIEDRILCMHGGIGRSISHIDQIAALQRPLTMEDGGIVLMDLLWSDPTTNDAVEGVQPSPRGPGLVTFGPDRVMEFCKVRDGGGGEGWGGVSEKSCLAGESSLFLSDHTRPRPPNRKTTCK